MKIMLAPTATRVNQNTSDNVNARIRAKTQDNINFYSAHRDRIPSRLQELDQEWDVERALATGSSTLTLIGLGLAYAFHPYWLFLSLGVQLFYMLHALQGWCPPLPIFRALGFRTEKEIQFERNALKLVREAKIVVY
jgi:hypothetical protein